MFEECITPFKGPNLDFVEAGCEFALDGERVLRGHFGGFSVDQETPEGVFVSGKGQAGELEAADGGGGLVEKSAVADEHHGACEVWWVHDREWFRRE